MHNKIPPHCGCHPHGSCTRESYLQLNVLGATKTTHGRQGWAENVCKPRWDSGHPPSSLFSSNTWHQLHYQYCKPAHQHLILIILSPWWWTKQFCRSSQLQFRQDCWSSHAWKKYLHLNMKLRQSYRSSVGMGIFATHRLWVMVLPAVRVQLCFIKG